MFLEIKRQGEVPVVDKPVVLEPWQQLLLRAADIIEEHGWCQYRLRNGESYCAIAALASAGCREIKNNACRRLAFYVGHNIDIWNDDPSRTKAEVIAAMRNCAAAG